MSTTAKITGREYTTFEQAYDWCNTYLFEGSLPACMLTLQARGAPGHPTIAATNAATQAAGRRGDDRVRPVFRSVRCPFRLAPFVIRADRSVFRRTRPASSPSRARRSATTARSSSGSVGAVT